MRSWATTRKFVKDVAWSMFWGVGLVWSIYAMCTKAAYPSQFTTSAYPFFTPYIKCILCMLVILITTLFMGVIVMILVLLVGLIRDKQSTTVLPNPAVDGLDSRTTATTRKTCLYLIPLFLLIAMLAGTIAIRFAMLLLPEGTPVVNIAVSLWEEYVPVYVRALYCVIFGTNLALTIAPYVSKHDEEDGTPDIEIGEVGAGSADDLRVDLGDKWIDKSDRELS